MRQLTLLVLAAAVVAVTAQRFSVTTNMAVSFGGPADERTLGVVADRSGFIYAVGEAASQVVNVSYSTGGPQGTTTNRVAATFSSAGADGFLTKFAPNGMPIWTLKLNGTGNESIASVALSPLQDVVYICGSFSSATASLGASSLNNAQSDGTYDAFVAAVNATTSVPIWSVTAYSAYNDYCRSVAATATSVVIGGSYANDNPSGTAATFQATAGTAFALTQRTGSEAYGNPYLLRLAAADGSGQYLNKGLLTHALNSPQLGGEVTALTFDVWGFLWAAGVGRSNPASAPDYNFGNGAGTEDVVVSIYHNQTIDTATFENTGAFRFTGARASVMSGWIGSAGKDVVTSIAVVNSAMVVPNADTLAASRVFIAGYTVGAADYTFNFTSPKAINAPVKAANLQSAAPAATSAWAAVLDGYLNGTGAGVWGGFVNATATLQTRITAMSYDRDSASAFVAGVVKGVGAMNVDGAMRAVGTAGGSWDACMMRMGAAGGRVGWLEVTGGPFDDYGLASAVVVTSGVPNPTPRPFIFLGGAFANVSVDTPLTAPVTRRSAGGLDAFIVSYDDVDDCGLSAPGPYGANPCGVTTNPTAPGASLCLDQPNYPLCFCNMNYTSVAPGFCNARGWDCSFMAPYYLGLLNICNCPAAANPSPNPLNDIVPRLTACAGNVCGFGSLTGPYQSCLPLTLNLLNTCGASPATPQSDRQSILSFNAVYNACPPPPAGSSSTGVVEFGAAPRAASFSAGAVAMALAAIVVSLLI